MRHLIIRADADRRIGIGHVMRCLALGQAWRARGGSVSCVTCCDSPATVQNLRDNGICVRRIPAAHPDPDDLACTREHLAQAVRANLDAPCWLVLDGYHFDPGYQKALQGAAWRTMIVDDSMYQPAYHADMLLNPNIYAEKLRYPCDSRTALLLGKRYAMLREEFLEAGRSGKRTADPVRRLLVTMGGADPENVTTTVLCALALLDSADLEVKCVVGPANPHLDTITAAAAQVPGRVEMVGAAKSRMSELMSWADMAVTGGGATCTELAFMGVPLRRYCAG